MASSVCFSLLALSCLATKFHWIPVQYIQYIYIFTLALCFIKRRYVIYLLIMFLNAKPWIYDSWEHVFTKCFKKNSVSVCSILFSNCFAQCCICLVSVILWSLIILTIMCCNLLYICNKSPDWESDKEHMQYVNRTHCSRCLSNLKEASDAVTLTLTVHMHSLHWKTFSMLASYNLACVWTEGCL